MTAPLLDPEAYPWLEITGDPASPYLIHHDIAILAADRDAGAIDLLIRFDDRGGHCTAHRHVTTTSVLVLSGEQHLDEMHPDGTVVHKVRRAGEHHLTTGDPFPHRERGGPDGAVVFFSHHAPDGRLYEIVDETGAVVSTVTVDSLITMWENR